MPELKKGQNIDIKRKTAHIHRSYALPSLELELSDLRKLPSSVVNLDPIGSGPFFRIRNYLF